jgi:hypothetical protein
MFLAVWERALIRQAVSVLFRAACLEVRLLPTMPVAAKSPKLPPKNETDARRLQMV